MAKNLIALKQCIYRERRHRHRYVIYLRYFIHVQTWAQLIALITHHQFLINSSNLDHVSYTSKYPLPVKYQYHDNLRPCGDPTNVDFVTFAHVLQLM